MRRVAFAGLVVVLFASHATAEPAAYKAVVTDAEVKLRAGPSDSFPETGTLRRGSVVVVEKEEGNGWLAVTAYGSVSWVATQFVEDPTPEKAAPKNVFVHADDEVTLAAGKVGLDQPLDIRRAKIPNGTTLVVLGPRASFAGKTWYMIQSPPGDVRYLPKTAVQFDKPATNNFVVRVNESVTPALSATPPAAGAIATISGQGSTATNQATSTAVNHPLWAQAEAAERDNRLADAEKAYFELASKMNAPGGDNDIANLCYTRIHNLREKKRNTTATPLSTQNMVPLPTRDERGVRPGTPQPILTNTGTSNTAKEDAPQWSGVGVLRRTAVTPVGAGRRTYALESSPGVLKVYVVADENVDLERYVAKRVDVYGTIVTRNTGLSKPYMIATEVKAAP